MVSEMRKSSQRSARLLRGDDVASNKTIVEKRTEPSCATANLKMPGSSSSSLSGSLPSSSLVAKRKVEELFGRLQPHSLVQSTEKLLATLRINPTLFVNGEELAPIAPPASTVAGAASAARSRRPTPTTAAWRFKPDAGRFHYGLSLQYISTDPELTRSSLKDVSVMVTSTTMHTPRCLPLASGGALSSKVWRLVAETDRRVGLSLYELTLGDWHASSLIALVWTQTNQVARFFLQLHTTELLYSAPPRALHVRRDDDLDRTHGLHSYTAAISLRSLDDLFWEREVYQVAFPLPEHGGRSVDVQLLDPVHGGTISVRDRVLTSETEPAFKLETEAVKYTMDNCLLVDFTLWDADCVPVWGFSRVLDLSAASRQQDEDESVIDLSISSLGGTSKRLQMQFQDPVHGNELVVSLTKLSPSATAQEPAKRTKLWVSQINLALSLEFINATFGTKY